MYCRCVRIAYFYFGINTHTTYNLFALTFSSINTQKLVYCTFNNNKKKCIGKKLYLGLAYYCINPIAKRRMKGTKEEKKMKYIYNTYLYIYIYCIIRCLIGNASIGRRLFSDDFFLLFFFLYVQCVCVCVCCFVVRLVWTSHSFDFCQLYRCSRVQEWNLFGFCECAVHSAVH